ncbi:hypothetical protein HPB49_013760 [Dermacentor silvarum]|uniref:Uncharacterized protein n=1 Tax=Dermacentor silvarum TaxID=543639 RepID=A0ACB8CFD5_DERSI|nr:hypothetical protein HPB49_013760 [Dermacentor silvarum]
MNQVLTKRSKLASKIAGRSRQLRGSPCSHFLSFRCSSTLDLIECICLNLAQGEGSRRTLVHTVQKRGGAVIAARKLSSAMSAAKAAADHMHDWWHGIPEGHWVSMAVLSDGSYGSPADVMFSYPVHIDSQRRWRIVDGLSMSDFVRQKIQVTGQELVEERNEALAFCKN